MAQTSAITIKVTGEMKKQMKQIEVNWSEYIRGCVQRKIDEQKIRAASAKLDEIRARAKPVTNDELVSWIREGREQS
jgi:hypothetical protein